MFIEPVQHGGGDPARRCRIAAASPPQQEWRCWEIRLVVDESRVVLGFQGLLSHQRTKEDEAAERYDESGSSRSGDERDFRGFGFEISGSGP